MAERGGAITLTRGFARRSWVIERVEAWLSAPEGPPVMLLTGEPGSGKSSVLLQYLALIEAAKAVDGTALPQVIGTVLRHPKVDDSFDATVLLARIVAGLAPGVTEGWEHAALPIPQINVENVTQEVGRAERVTAVAVSITAGALSALGGLLPEAVRRVRSAPAGQRTLVVVDALDQAEDEGGEEFLRVLDALTGAAQGTGVRFLCASRRRTSVWLAPARVTTLDLVDDAMDLDGELQAYLERRFQSVAPHDRRRLVETLVGGAQGNWLWATTNAAALETQIAESGVVPERISLTEGLEGLYGDGVRRIQQRVGRPVWESKTRPLLGAVACCFSGGIGHIELRWVTGMEDADVVSLVEVCRPFVDYDARGRVRLFHPDFGRWLLSGSLAGISEKSEHLKLAAGLSRLGITTRWGPVTRDYAAPWVLSHWFSLFILDPFHPDMEEHEQQVERILTDVSWAERAGSVVESIEQAGRIMPRLRMPGLPLPLSVGFRTLVVSEAAAAYVGTMLTSGMTEQDIDAFDALPDDDERSAWLDERLPDYRVQVSQTLWANFLRGHYEIRDLAGRFEVRLTPSCVMDLLGKASPDGDDKLLSLAASLCQEVGPELLPDLIDQLTALLGTQLATTIRRAAHACLGSCHKSRSAHRSPDDEEGRMADLSKAVAAYATAWRLAGSDREWRLDYAIDVANTIRELSSPSLEQLDLLVSAQAEIRDLRRDAEDPTWSSSANRLGDAYAQRARSRPPGSARTDDIGLALEAYLEAWNATPAEDGKQRLAYAIDVANKVWELPSPSVEQLDLLVSAQEEIRDLRLAANDPTWPLSAYRLGRAYGLRAKRLPDEPVSPSHLTLALEAYLQAWNGIPRDHEDRLDCVIGLANTLFALPQRSVEQLDLLVSVQKEIRDLRLAADDQGWPAAADLLGRAYELRAKGVPDQPPSQSHLALALQAYLQAWNAAVDSDGEQRLVYAINVANTVRELSSPSVEQLDVLVSAQAEIRDLRRAAEDPTWPSSATRLADAYTLRARTRSDEEARSADLELALQAGLQAWDAVAADDDAQRLTCAICVANTILELSSPSAEQLDLLVSVQAEIRDLRRAADDPEWLSATGLLGEAYTLRARSRSDESARSADLALAVEVCLEAWDVPEAGSGRRLAPAIGIANALFVMPQLSMEQLDLLVSVQAEIRDLRLTAGDPAWPLSAARLGKAYELRAGATPDEPARLADLGLALEAYLQAWDEIAPDDVDRLDCAIGLANTLFALPERSAQQLDLLVSVQAEIRDIRRAADDRRWPAAADLLGRAYELRAGSRPDEAARLADLGRALEAYLQAWDAVAPHGRDRLDYAIGVANTLFGLPARSMEQLDLLVSVQAEIRDLRRAADDPEWPAATNLLGDAYALRARARPDEPPSRQHLMLALESYVQAWNAAAEGDLEQRLVYAIDVANTVRELSPPSAEQLDLWVSAQAEICALRRADADPEWPAAANLLGDAYAMRADGRSDESARLADLAHAVDAYDEALRRLPAHDPRRLDYAIDAANTRVIHAAIGRQNGQAALDEAMRLVLSEAVAGMNDYTKLRRLLPVLLARLRRHQWWSTPKSVRN